jgi:hypothetical protein
MRRAASPSPWEPEPGLEPALDRRRAWLWRLLYVLYSLEVGSFLLFLPWLRIWDNNYLLYRFPDFRPVVTSPFLKGAVLGLGLVNLGIGFQEIGRLRRRRAGSLGPRSA